MLVPSATQINRIIDGKGSTGPIRTKFQMSKEKTLSGKNHLLMSLRKKIPPFSQIFLKGKKVPNNQ
jgi:hypothetical protein